VSLRILTQTIRAELDVVASRQRARQIAGLCGFNGQDQVRIATAVSELARNVYSYAGTGRVSFSIEGETAPQLLVIAIVDEGPGISQLDLVLSGRYQSPTGMGLGLLGARRMMDQCDIKTGAAGTSIVLRKLLPASSPVMTAALVGEVGGQLAALPADVTISEMQQQNKELLATLSELKTRQDELLELTRELEDTNRGVVALYAELDEKADHLRRADEMKSRFLSNMSHEFRTPLSSIRALSRLLIDRVDGELTVEQDKQARYILAGAESLTDLVDDLLDLAKIEAGKIDVRPVQFNVGDMFSALRGMLRPLLVSDTVDLVFDEPETPIGMFTDEAKLSQIVRNFISNALKFTERGEVRVAARLIAGGAAVEFSVRDTGLGIAPANQQLIFEEFSQVENPLQSRAKGTGLGLPLCRKLAHLLGGEVSVESTLREGSVFRATVALQYSERPSFDADPNAADGGNSEGIPVLVVEDNPSVMLLYKTFFRDSPYRMISARSTWEADQVLRAGTPGAVLLDLYLTGEDTWRWLSDFKSDPASCHVPVIVASEVNDPNKAFALGAEAYFTKPLRRDDLLNRLAALCATSTDDRGRGLAPR
jgi:signal transduction histidine kinase/CheY-like chemotaxis protein